jgi:hypothetical protein
MNLPTTYLNEDSWYLVGDMSPGHTKGKQDILPLCATIVLRKAGHKSDTLLRNLQLWFRPFTIVQTSSNS